MLKAVIIDDEPRATDMLGNLLQMYCPAVKVVEKAYTIEGAINAITTHKPDLIFLDVEIPPGTGFEILERVPERNFEVIFTTAHDEYALNAIKFSALDYLLKPIDVDELTQAVEKVESKLNNMQFNESINILLDNIPKKGPLRLALPVNEGLCFVEIDQVIRIESSGSYSCFYLNDGRKLMVSKTLKEFTLLLEDHHFFRAHNSHLINLNQVKQYVKHDGGYVIMSDGAKVELARRKKDSFVQLMLKSN